MATVPPHRHTTVPPHSHVEAGTGPPPGYPGAGGDVDAKIGVHAAEADPHTGYQKESEKGQPSGYASLDLTGDVPIGELPTGTTSSTVAIGDHGHTAGFTFFVDGGGEVIATGLKGFLKVPFDCEITESEIESDVSTSTVMDPRLRAFGGGAAASIAASAKPTLSAETEAKDSTLTGWTTTLSEGDKLYFYVDSNSAATKLALSFTLAR